MNGHEPQVNTTPMTYTVYEIAEILKISRTSAYRLIREGHFKTIRIGSAIRISKKSFEEWMEKSET